MKTHAYAVLGTTTALVAGALAFIVLDAAESQRAARPATTERASRCRARPASTQREPVESDTLRVTYPPGESSAPHAHPCPVVGYVLEGAIRMRVGDERETVYRVGEGFYEEANAPHLISANASNRERAQFLAFFTCDREGPLSAPLRDVVR